MQREFSESQPELMDLPNQDETALRSDLEHLARLNKTFGGRKAVETVFPDADDREPARLPGHGISLCGASPCAF